MTHESKSHFGGLTCLTDLCSECQWPVLEYALGTVAVAAASPAACWAVCVCVCVCPQQTWEGSAEGLGGSSRGSLPPPPKPAPQWASPG